MHSLSLNVSINLQFSWICRYKTEKMQNDTGVFFYCKYLCFSVDRVFQIQREVRNLLLELLEIQLIKHLSPESVLYHSSSNSVAIAQKKYHQAFQLFAALICYCLSEGGYSANDLKCAVFPQPALHQIPKVTKNKNKLDNVPPPSKVKNTYIERGKERGGKGDVHIHTKELVAAKLSFAFNATDCLTAATLLTLL